MSGHLLQAVADQLMPHPPERLGVAVSGGGDSVALLCLLAEFAKSKPIDLQVITVEHGLREAAVEEVRGVTDLCARLGVPHHVEYWTGWDGTGNLQDRARDARYQIMADWAMQNDIHMIAVAHTANDQAETLMMRLARGAGVDGLSAMTARRVRHGVTWLRPLLRIHRRDLRNYLLGIDVPWFEDASNENRDFDRIKMRDALRLLEPLGLTVDTLVQVAHQMSKVREALDWQTFIAARDVTRVTHGAIAFDMRRCRTLPEEILRRLLIRGVMWLSADIYPPRRDTGLRAVKALRDGRAMTLEGCQLVRDGDLMWLFREYNAVKDLTAEVGDLWDNRWYITGPEDDPGLVVRALGEDGMAQVTDRIDNALPRAALLSSPSVWEGATLVAAPLVREDEGWTAELEGGQDAFFAALLSH